MLDIESVSESVSLNDVNLEPKEKIEVSALLKPKMYPFYNRVKRTSFLMENLLTDDNNKIDDESGGNLGASEK